MTYPNHEQPQRRADAGPARGRADDDGWFSSGLDQAHIDHLDWLAHGGDLTDTHLPDYDDLHADPTRAAAQRAHRAVHALPPSGPTGPAELAGLAEALRREELARHADTDPDSREPEWGDAR